MSTPAVAYYKDKHLVYVEIGDVHFTTDGRWFEYLELRRRAPKLVTTFSRLFELQRELLRGRNIVV